MAVVSCCMSRCQACPEPGFPKRRCCGQGWAPPTCLSVSFAKRGLNCLPQHMLLLPAFFFFASLPSFFHSFSCLQVILCQVFSSGHQKALHQSLPQMSLILCRCLPLPALFTGTKGAASNVLKSVHTQNFYLK